jgi:hypothetical protein
MVRPEHLREFARRGLLWLRYIRSSTKRIGRALHSLQRRGLEWGIEHACELAIPLLWRRLIRARWRRLTSGLASAEHAGEFAGWWRRLGRRRIAAGRRRGRSRCVEHARELAARLGRRWSLRRAR